MTNRFGISPSFIAVGSVVVAFGAGAGAGYLISKRHFEAITDNEVATFKADYAARQDAHIQAMEMANLNRIEKSELAEKVEELGYAVTEEATPEKNPRIFDTAPRRPDWDEEGEAAFRAEIDIYILTKNEFFLNEVGHEQEQLTYYEDDDVLATNKDEIVTDVVVQVGSDCLTKFGYGSEDNDTVYVRNESWNTDYEIIRTDGKYSEIVLGLGTEDEIRHSAGTRRFRSYHDQ